MKKLIAVLLTFMLSNSVLAMGEMGKGECIYADNGSRKSAEVIETTDQETATVSTSNEDVSEGSAQ